MPPVGYVGEELELFRHAENWKSYWGSQVKRYVRGDVADVGAGLGANLRALFDVNQNRWLCVEPDAQLASRLVSSLDPSMAARVDVLVGTLDDLPGDRRFDTILYIDVLEHIAEDAAEIRRAAGHLRSNGSLVVLSPAHQWLFSAFDRSIGHRRRYTRDSLRQVVGAGLRLEKLVYLDACGLLASAANRLLLRQSMPRLEQVLFWDRRLVPISRRLDRLCGGRVGKSVLGVWKK